MNDKKKTSGKPRAKANANATKKAPVVKEVKVSEVANEDEDKKLIVVIAIAILIIIGTVIGLLVGCTNPVDKLVDEVKVKVNKEIKNIEDL